jgi:ceramide glucosyltransferase
MKAYRQAAHDILWVIDSNVWVHPGTLARSVDALSQTTRSGRRVGLVHHVPFALATDSGLGSRVEEAFLNTNHAKMYVAINTVAIDSCVVGKSNMYRRSDLERVNGSLMSAKASKEPAEQTGLPAFAKFLAEDNLIASALWHELDLRHDLSSDVAQNVVGRMTMRDYLWRRVRWIRVRKQMVLAATLVEPLTEGLVLGAIGSASLFHLFHFPTWISALLHCMLWLGVDLDIYCSLAGHALPSTIRRQFIIGWAIRELLAFPIWILAMLGNTVTWRGRKYRILRNGEVEQVNIENSLRPWFRVWKRTDYELANDDDC